MMRDDGLAVLTPYDAIYFGAVGESARRLRVPVWGLILPIRQTFHLGFPVWEDRIFAAVRQVLKDPKARTPDMGGTGTTRSAAAVIRRCLEEGLADD